MSAETALGRAVQLLGRVPLFRGLPRSDLERIAGLGSTREAQAGEFVFREGDPADRLYLVLEGAVEVLKERPLGDHERLGVKRGGEAVGEAALLSDAPRTASVRAVETARLLAIGRDDFEDLLGGESLSLRLLRGMATTLRALDLRFPARPGADAVRAFGRLVLSGLEPGALPPVDGFRAAGATARAEGIAGGSLWDGFATGDGRVLLALMDVKGTGLPPAYLIGVTRAILREAGPREPFEGLLRRLNAATFANLFEGHDECIEAAVIRLADGALSWSSAGDQPAFILRVDGGVEEVGGHGPPLGILPHFDYGTDWLDLAAGDTLLAFSEAPAGMVKGALELAQARRDTEPGELARLLQAAFQKIQARGAATDISFLVVRKS